MEVQNKLLKTQDRQKDNIDKSRKVHPMVSIGDKVWLLYRNMKTNCPCDKLDFHRLWPFPVIKQINDVAFCLELPPSIKIHLVFHVSFSSRIKNHLYQAGFRYHLLELHLKKKKNFKSQKSSIQESIAGNWSILFNGMDTTLVKRPSNLLPILLMPRKWFENFIVDIQKNQIPKMLEFNTSGPTPTPYLSLSMVRV
jgi:hypothetical protein